VYLPKEKENMRRVCLLLTCSLVASAAAATADDQHRLYDCAANCLYLFCSLTNNKISYNRSVELLPVTDKGNSMLELNVALQKCGFETEAKIIRAEDLAKVKSPSIVLYYPSNKPNAIGHFFILMPQHDQIAVYDYPREVHTFPTSYLIAGLKQEDIHEFPILICKIKRNSG
jgi:ABC-type bacteriocin/lantibiotic exporter with double-glycine peptidase domain